MLLHVPEIAQKPVATPWPSEVWEKWGSLVEEFRGGNQASLALLLSSFDPSRLGILLG